MRKENRKGMELFKAKDKDQEVLVVGISDKAVSMSASSAEQIAESKGLDLVSMNDTDDKPVLKLCNYKKLVYDSQKKEKENRKRQRKNQQDIKEVKITYGTSEHDLETKAKAIDKFLSSGYRVIISIQFKGRTIKYIDNGKEKIDSLLNLVKSNYIIYQSNKVDGNKVSTIITPKING